MPTFYLQQQEEGGRLIIDESVPDGAYIHDFVVAPDWMTAKRDLGFYLGREQERMLDEREEVRMGGDASKPNNDG